MLHHDTFFITADKLWLNKLSQLTTHLSHVKPLSPQQRGTSCHFDYRVPKLLQMLLAAFVSSKSWAAEVESELLHASCCQIQAYAGHRTARMSFRPPDTILRVLWERPSSGDWLQSMHHGRNMTSPHWLWGCDIPPCESWGKWPWSLTPMNWPRHLNAAFWKWKERKLGEIL
jgi:hypothetical protein